MDNLFCFICDHKFTDQEIIDDQFNICCNPDCILVLVSPKQICSP